MAFFNSIPWHENYPAAKRAAAQQRQLLLVQFLQPGRPMCERLRRDTLTDADVQRLARRYTPVLLDPSQHSQCFARLIGGGGALAACILDAELGVLSVLEGYATVERYRRFLASTLERHSELLALQRRLETSPGDGRVRLQLADTLHALGNWRSARLQLEQLVAETADDVELNSMAGERLARLFLDRGQVQLARQQLAKLQSSSSPTPAEPERASFTQALLQFAERDLHGTRRQLIEWLERYPRGTERHQVQRLLSRVQKELFAKWNAHPADHQH